MGGKRQQSPAAAAASAGPRGPRVAGPVSLGAAGPPILAKVLGPQQAANNAAFDSTRDTSASIVGTVAGIIANAFYPGTGGITSKLAESTVKQQYNTFGGRPFFEGQDKTWEDWPGLLIGTAAGYAGGAAGAYLGGAASAGSVPAQAGYTAADAATGAANVGGGVGGLTSAGTSTGAAIGGALGSRAGGYLGNYVGGLVQRSIYGGGRVSQYKRDPYKRTYIYGR